MKLIIAYIRPEKLNDVKQALYAREIYSLSITNVLGSGRRRDSPKRTAVFRWR